MHVDLRGQPAYTIALITLDEGEAVFTEAGSISVLSQGIDVHAKTFGGAVKALIRKQFAHESFFMAECRAKLHEAWVMVAPKYPGDIATIDVGQSGPLMIEAGSLLAIAETVDLDTRYAGLSNIVLHEGAAALRCEGHGALLVCSYGSMNRFEVPAGDRIIVDTGYLLAWSDGMGFRVGPLQGMLSSQLTGEGLVAEITGPGVVYTQSRAAQGLRDWILPQMGPNKRGSGRNA